MKNLYKIIFFVSILYVNAMAQTVTWQKWYDYNNFENSGKDVIQTFDGGYLVLTNNYTTDYSSVLMKTDKFGNIEWQKLYDHSNLNGATLTSTALSQCLDSGFVISGNTPQFPILIKVDKYGEIIWFKNFPKPGFISGIFSDHKITSDGGIIACGYLFDPATEYIVKTDLNGIIEWDSLYAEEYLFDKIIESSSGFYYLLELGYETNPLLAKINNEGRVLWRKRISNNMKDLVEYSSESIFIAAGHDSLVLSKVDTAGAIIFQKSYFQGILGCSAMCISHDRNFLLTGIKIINDAFLMAVSKIDSMGNLIFSKVIPSLTDKGNFAFLPRAVNSTNDSGFIFTGFTDYPNYNPYRPNTIVVKTDSTCYASLIVNVSNNILLIPEKSYLLQNYPNPFNPQTLVRYELFESGIVEITIYDINGTEVCKLIDKFHSPGRYELLFNAEQYNLASGIYFCKMNFDEKSKVNKLLYIK